MELRRARDWVLVIVEGRKNEKSAMDGDWCLWYILDSVFSPNISMGLGSVGHSFWCLWNYHIKLPYENTTDNWQVKPAREMLNILSLLRMLGCSNQRRKGNTPSLAPSKSLSSILYYTPQCTKPTEGFPSQCRIFA
jgi:hypothetical protein